jgi:hypothetical protein
MPREALLGELRSLNARELALLLQPLTADERRKVLAQLREPSPQELPMPPFAALAGLSPWLLKAIERSEGVGGAAGSMTPAARSALARALKQLTVEEPAGGGPQRRLSQLARFLPRREKDLGAA